MSYVLYGVACGGIFTLPSLKKEFYFDTGVNVVKVFTDFY